MRIGLPAGWGPATVLVMLYALGVVVGGAIEIAQGDMSLAEYLNEDATKWLAGAAGLLAAGRGLAFVGGDPGWAKEPAAPAEPEPDGRPGVG